MSNNNSSAKKKSLELSIADCERIEEEFTKKAVNFSNSFTNNQLRAGTVEKIISKLDPLNKIKLVYDDNKKEKQAKPVKKSNRIKRAVITAITTASLMGIAYFGGLVYFGKQKYEAELQGLKSSNSLVFLQKQNLKKNNMFQQEYITQLQNHYKKRLGQIYALQKKYGIKLAENNCLQKKSSVLEQKNSTLTDRITELEQEQLQLNTERSKLKSRNLEVKSFIDEQIIQRAKKYGEYRRKGPFNEFTRAYAEFFFGRKPKDNEKQIIDELLRKYVLTDGKSVEETVQSWKCRTIILQYNKKLRVRDP